MRPRQCGAVLMVDGQVQVCEFPAGLHSWHQSVDWWYWRRPWWRRFFDRALLR